MLGPHEKAEIVAACFRDIDRVLEPFAVLHPADIAGRRGLNVAARPPAVACATAHDPRRGVVPGDPLAPRIIVRGRDPQRPAGRKNRRRRTGIGCLTVRRHWLRVRRGLARLEGEVAEVDPAGEVHPHHLGAGLEIERRRARLVALPRARVRRRDPVARSIGRASPARKTSKSRPCPFCVEAVDTSSS